jgi:hypothetical protein
MTQMREAIKVIFYGGAGEPLNDPHSFVELYVVAKLTPSYRLLRTFFCLSR